MSSKRIIKVIVGFFLTKSPLTKMYIKDGSGIYISAAEESLPSTHNFLPAGSMNDPGIQQPHTKSSG
jgi:hypothetical protein